MRGLATNLGQKELFFSFYRLLSDLVSYKSFKNTTNNSQNLSSNIILKALIKKLCLKKGLFNVEVMQAI